MCIQSDSCPSNEMMRLRIMMVTKSDSQSIVILQQYVSEHYVMAITTTPLCKTSTKTIPMLCHETSSTYSID